MTAATDPAELAAKAAKDARRAMVITVFAVLVAVLVLAIDNSIKRAIVAEAQRVRGMVNDLEAMAGGIKAAGAGGAGDLPVDSPADTGSGGVADDPGARTASNGDAPAGKPAGRGRAGSRKPGP